MNGGWGISCEITLRWMPIDLNDDKSTLVEVMAWCRQATSHYLSQCWPRSVSPNGITRPQWVNGITHSCLNSLVPGRPGCHFKTAIYNLVLLIGLFRSSNGNAPRWMPWDLMDDQSTLFQVMTWCRQATSHYLIQCSPSYFHVTIWCHQATMS